MELDLATIIIVAAQAAVAAGTIFLALATRRAIRKSDEWNKRIEERTLEWNKRNEWTRALPFLSVERVDHESMGHGLFKRFTVSIKNIGLGPVVFFIVKAQQGKNKFKQLVSVYHPESTGHCRPIGVNDTPFKIEFETMGTAKASKKSPSPIVVFIAFWDIFGRTYEISYELQPVSTVGAEGLDALSDPRIVSLKMNGKEIKIPSIKDLSNVEFQGMGEPFFVNL